VRDDDGIRERIDVRGGRRAEDGAGWLTFFPGPGRPRRDRRAPRDVGRPQRTGRGDRRRPAGRDLAEVPHALRGKPHERYPQSSWPWVKTLLHAVYDQPDVWTWTA
jgi:hypothetical protein